MLSHALRAKVQNSTIPTPTDANFKQVSLLLHGDGTNGAQNNTFIDSSTNNFTVTRNGNTTQGTNTPFSQDAGYWSNYNPTASYLTVATNAAFTYGVSDFTMECWVYLTTTGAIQYIIDQRNSGTANAIIPAIYVSAANVLTYFVSNAAQITGTTALTVGTWYHVAVSRSTLSTKMFLNGVQEGSTYTDTNSYAASRVVIGSNAATAGNYLVGYVSNVRLVNGTGVYTTTFTPPTTPLTAITNTSLLTCQSNYFKDNSSNNFTLTATGTPSVQPFSPFAPTSAYSTSVNGGSMYFNKTTDSLTSPTNTALSPRTGDWTFECWVYLSSVTGYQAIFDYGQYTGGVLLRTNNASLDYYELGAYVANIASVFTASVWTHIAVSRNSGTLKIFKDGVQIYSGASSGDINPSSPNNYVRIGAQSPTPTFFLGGYISNARYLVGTGLYTTAFTPPTAPLTAITNTSLLLNGTNAGIYDNAIKNDLETVGNAQVSTSVTKFGTGSMSFDGTGDWLTLPSSQQLAQNTGNFTYEFWLYPTTSTNQYVFTTGATPDWISSDGVSIVIYTGSFYFSCGSTYTTGGSGTAPTLNVWQHIALVRNGTTVTLYKDGVAASVTLTSSANLTGTKMLVGTGTAATWSSLNGYIDDLRVTKGIARYTANFTPPTAAFPNQ